MFRSKHDRCGDDPTVHPVVVISPFDIMGVLEREEVTTVLIITILTSFV